MVPYLYDGDRLEMAFGLASDTYHDHIRYNPRLYLKADNQSYTLKALEEVFHLNLNRKYYLPKDLNRLCKKKNKKYLHTTI